MAPRNRRSFKRSASSDSTYSRAEFRADFPDDDACLAWLWRHLHSAEGTHADCPKCGVSRKFHRVQSRPSYSCDVCGHHIHPTASTIFHKSSTNLVLWFEAVYLMSSTRCGISAKQLEREIGVTYKTAWRMMHLIRRLLLEDGQSPLFGQVEVDETYVGGSRRNTIGRTGDHKSPVLAMVERRGRVYATTVKDAARSTLMPHIESRVLPASVVYTDEWKSYAQLGKRGYVHKRIQHKQKVYVRGDVHTNTIEGFFSLLKRGISGVYHSVSAKHLQGYLDEYTFRYNHRNDDKPMFRTLLENVASGQMSQLASDSPS